MRQSISRGAYVGWGLLLALLVVAWPPQAVGTPAGAGLGQGHGNRQGRGEEEQQGEGREHRGARFGFVARDREVIENYYRGSQSGLPPGLAKRGGNLPPGLEKHLERDGTLPPGLQKRLAPLPVELERRLAPLPPDCGCQRGIIGADVVWVRKRDGRIVDLVHVAIGR